MKNQMINWQFYSLVLDYYLLYLTYLETCVLKGVSMHNKHNSYIVNTPEFQRQLAWLHYASAVSVVDHTSSWDHLWLTEPWPGPAAHGQSPPGRLAAAASGLQLPFEVPAESGQTGLQVMRFSTEVRWLLAFAANGMLSVMSASDGVALKSFNWKPKFSLQSKFVCIMPNFKT